MARAQPRERMGDDDVSVDDKSLMSVFDQPRPTLGRVAHCMRRWEPVAVAALPIDFGGGYAILDKTERSLVFFDAKHSERGVSRPPEFGVVDLAWVDLASASLRRNGACQICVLTTLEILAYHLQTDRLDLIWRLAGTARFCSLAVHLVTTSCCTVSSFLETGSSRTPSCMW